MKNFQVNDLVIKKSELYHSALFFYIYSLLSTLSSPICFFTNNKLSFKEKTIKQHQPTLFLKEEAFLFKIKTKEDGLPTHPIRPIFISSCLASRLPNLQT